MTAHEVVIRLGRPRDLQLRGTRAGASPAFSADITEVTVPFADYRPAVAGEVVRTEADARFAGDLARAVREQRAREALEDESA